MIRFVRIPPLFSINSPILLSLSLSLSLSFRSTYFPSNEIETSFHEFHGKSAARIRVVARSSRRECSTFFRTLESPRRIASKRIWYIYTSYADADGTHNPDICRFSGNKTRVPSRRSHGKLPLLGTDKETTRRYGSPRGPFDSRNSCRSYYFSFLLFFFFFIFSPFSGGFPSVSRRSLVGA